MAARGLVNGRSPLRRSGRDLVFRCYPPELLSPHKKQKLTFWVSPVSAVRKGLELALSRGDIVIRKPPVKHSLDIPSGEEVDGSPAMRPSENKKGPDFHQDRFCGAEGARTLDLRRDRPAF